MRKLIIMLLFLVLQGYGFAANHYVRAGATGTFDGTDWTNAYGTLPTTLVRGDTYYIADATYPSYKFQTANSGVATITIKKAVESDHGTDTGWASAYGNGFTSFGSNTQINTDNWVLDGQVGSGTDINSYGFRIAVPGNCNQVNRMFLIPKLGNPPVKNITVQYFAIRNCGAGFDYSQVSIYMAPQGGQNDNITIAHNYLSNSTNNMFIRSLKNSTIEWNYMTDGWSTSANHGEAISPGITNDTIWRYNYFINPGNKHWGTGIISWHLGGGTLTSTNNEVYGNVVIGGSVTNGTFGNGDSATANVINDSKFHHNTFINVSAVGGVSSGIYLPNASGNLVYNNLWYQSEKVRLNTGGILEHSHNTAINSTEVVLTGANEENFTGAADPFVNWANGDVHLTTSTSAGRMLSAPLDVDPDGNIRGSDGRWDRGAFEYLATTPTAPSNLRITVSGNND